MNNITLAIPFYNTSQYFTDCIKYALDDDFVSEIVVNDDCSSQDHFQNLVNTIQSLGSDKIQLYRNSFNLGAFRNKYQTVKNCTNDWVYLLDSDNHPFEETYQVIRNIPDTFTHICYSPAHLYCKNDSMSDYENISDYNFGYDVIGIKESKESLSKGVEWFNWFVNSGNYIFHRETYLNHLEESFNDFSVPLLHADTAAAFYFWLKGGGEFKVVKELRHNHRLRPDSNWHSCGDNSSKSANHYENAIKKL
jgi:hypothetical protein